MDAKASLIYRPAKIEDLDALVELENRCFSIDRLSRRSFRSWIQKSHADLIVTTSNGNLVAYALLWCHRGTRLARLYSIAVSPEMRGHGIADSLLQCIEELAIEKQRFYLRLEVAKNNPSAITCYERNGYRAFGEYIDYYEDHSDALRMQKRLHFRSRALVQRPTPWYQQTTEFTCGPASLMMAMGSLNEKLPLNQGEELSIWREATTIFMTSGHGGCHPIGLALAAKARGFKCNTWISTNKDLFMEGLRSEKKKAILSVVNQQFILQAQKQKLRVHYRDINQSDLEKWLKQGCAIVMLISTYRLDGKKAPHWVCITGVDEHCFYMHDPDPDELASSPIDNQYLPIAKEDFDLMSVFGTERLRTAVVLQPNS